MSNKLGFTESIDVEVRRLPCGEAFDVFDMAGKRIYAGLGASRLRELGVAVPERTTAVTVHLTDEEMEAVCVGFGDAEDRAIGKVADAILAHREAKQPGAPE